MEGFVAGNSPHSRQELSATPTSPPAGRNRRLDVQGLRAIAVLMVVAFHAGLPTPGGFVGVDVFFVISGFVITAMLMREWQKEGRLRLGRFYVRRFKRLAPALALTVGVVALASFLLLSPFGGQQTASKTGMGALLIAANFVISRTTGGYFDPAAENNVFLNLWSLAVEEQFYLFFPLLLLIGFLLAVRGRWLRLGPAAIVAVIGAGSLVLALYDSVGVNFLRVPPDLMGFYGPVTRVWEFAAGSLLALGGSRLSASTRRTAWPLGAVGAGLLAVPLLLIDEATPFPGPWTIVPVVGTALLIAAGGTPTALSSLLSSRPMVWVGDRSYSIYLWHWPIIVLARLNLSDAAPVLVVAAAVSFIPAYASYRWVEQPVRLMEKTGAAPFARLVATTVLPPLLVCAALGYAAGPDRWSDETNGYRNAIHTQHAAEQKRCLQAATWNVENCTWNGDAEGAPLYLIGDSNADHFSEAMIDTAIALGRPLVVRVENGCSYIAGGSTLAEPGWRERCDRFVPDTESYLLGAEEGDVVIANAYGDFREIFDGDRLDPIDLSGEATTTPLFLRLTATVAPLQEAGHKVLLVQTIPHWGLGESLNWQACTTWKLLWSGCQRTMPLSEAEARQGRIAEIVADVSASTGAGLLDNTQAICPDQMCANIASDGMVRYRDGVHITVDQSHALATAFKEAIEAQD